MPLRHLGQWMDALPQAEFVNLYGPTEITCNCTYHVVERSRTYPGELPLGIPFPNREVLLLADDGTVASSPGEVGEICVRGASLASGYAGLPSSAAASFVQNPRNSLFVDPLYRTGDYAVISEDGELFFRGRRDNQIKYQGHRIELEEIDKAAESVLGVTMCRSVFDAARERLYAFYVGDIDRRELIGAMAQLASELGVDYLDLNVGDAAKAIGIDWSTDSTDGGDHLNFHGAQKVSTYVGTYLKEQYGLADHRGDETISAVWNASLGKYEANVSAAGLSEDVS